MAEGAKLEHAVAWHPYLADAERPTAADLATLEHSLGRPLPADYERAALAHAGDQPSRARIRIGADGETLFGVLLVLVPGPGHARWPYSIQHGLETLEEWGWNAADRPVRYLPFGSNLQTSLFCFDYEAGTPSPPIVNVETTYDPDEPGGVLPVAESFTALLALLRD